MTTTLYLGDCLTELDQVPDESVNLVFVDPPYNIGVFCKMPPAEYLAWCEKWIALCSQKLTANGAFWVSHKNPRDSERKRAGVDKVAINVACGFSASAGGMASRHYFSRSQ